MTLQYKGIHLHFTDQGKGAAVVLLHGFLENVTMWDMLVPEIIKKHRAITIDLLGHGKTECLGYIHTMEDMADAVYAVLAHLKLRRVILIGHSMGGYVALAFAELYPEMIKGLCLANSTAVNDSSEKKINRDRAIRAVKQNHKSFIRMSIANLFSAQNRTRFTEDIESIKEEALNMSQQGIIAALEGMKIRSNRLFLLHTTSFKKLMIVGKQDPVLEYTTLIKQTKGLDIEIVEFPDGHMAHIENMYEFNYKILRFIEK